MYWNFDIGPNAEFHGSDVTSVPSLYFLYVQMCKNALVDSAISQLHALYIQMKLKVLENKWFHQLRLLLFHMHNF